jgi:flagellar biosynthesis protein FlhB
MSDASERPFEPTPQRLSKAKREGDVARSPELGANVAFAAGACAAAAVVPSIGALAREAIADAAAAHDPFPAVGGIVVAALVPVACAAIAGTAVALFQNGGLHFMFPAPKLERLNPVEGFKRALSRDTFGHCARAVLAFTVAAALMAPAIRVAAVQMSLRQPIVSVAQAAGSAAERVAGVAFAVGTIFAVAEYAAARRVWLRKLRMSFDDRKREMKEEEGDPLERGRRRALHRSLVRGALADVRKASFVVVNPTHVAVALRYDPPAVSVPTVLVRAAGEIAIRVRAVARRYSIPVVEDVALARALFRDGRVGGAIDRTHFVAVAEVVAALARAGLLDA